MRSSRILLHHLTVHFHTRTAKKGRGYDLAHARGCCHGIRCCGDRCWDRGKCRGVLSPQERTECPSIGTGRESYSLCSCKLVHMFQYAPCVILIQFSALHSRGSSHGQSRITRRAYNKPYYVPMMNDAYSLWSDLERESGSTLYRSEPNVILCQQVQGI